ncbi:hypothetical protein QQS21_001009 [Conoideocrella luteorostrata]|uniref:F-box domain-containing protein n=1 Tax=Conoideocrella luteorostrata TaxID=1105319 RepID=A0AAJ0FYM7_9HYPO|nr:hypothetical protein QQS21_001009 [Conoideocrella luteorostrata]
MAQIPVEIFEIITSHLTRADVKALRLVCREFESKVSGRYFRNVVVPFRSELYTSPDRDENGSAKQSSTDVLANGTRIFESFGPHITRFALSLEIDERSLAYPPIKPTQEVIRAFWGLYRWPHQNYHRFSELAGIERTADETKGMKEALRHLTQVRNLGLCCDAGLGFLMGPDVPAYAARSKHAVFSTVNIATSDSDGVAEDERMSPYPNLMAFRRKFLETMVLESGFTSSQVDDVIQTILKTERATLASIDCEERSAAVLALADTPHRHFTAKTVKETYQYPLMPSSLTRAQKEMLLELEWAHRAMIQSYILGLIDNAAIGSFENVTTLTIAKIPGCHVHSFCRDDVWEAIPSIKKVSLGVIADWRRITASGGYVQDINMSPVESVGTVFTLFDRYIAKYPNIESIHFEWICGGEFASGAYQRNSYILPAPFYEQPALMATAATIQTDNSKLLHLPHIKHLSLKNCWSSPHVLLQVIRQLALASLEKLELESVSLSGPPTIQAQASLLPLTIPPLPRESIADHMAGVVDNEFMQDLHGAQHHVPNLPATQYSTAPNTAPGYPNSQSADPFRHPDILTWAGIIDHFSPSIKIRKILAEQTGEELDPAILQEMAKTIRPFVPRADDIYNDENWYQLKCLSLKSCGYVFLDTPYLNTRSILPEPGIVYEADTRCNEEFMYMMQSCRDKLLGKINPCIKFQEEIILDAFGVTLGWEGIYDESVILNAKTDGVGSPGQGRINCLLEASDAGSRSRQPSPSWLD